MVCVSVHHLESRALRAVPLPMRLRIACHLFGTTADLERPRNPKPEARRRSRGKRPTSVPSSYAPTLGPTSWAAVGCDTT